MEKQKSLLDLVLDPVEADRVASIAEVLYRADMYVRALSLMCGGVATKADPTTARDLYAVQQSAENVSDWLSPLWIELYDHSKPAPAQAEDRPIDSTLH